MRSAGRIALAAMLMALAPVGVAQSTAQTRSAAAANPAAGIDDLDPAVQQQQQQTRSAPPAVDEARAGTAESSVGRAGERLTREQNTTVAPMARIASRIRNRVDARIRNRIDRNYDPRANAVSPFERADEQTRRRR